MKKEIILFHNDELTFKDKFYYLMDMLISNQVESRFESYLLMGISLLISLKENKESDVIKSFVLQLIFNYLWPILFFTLKMYTFSIVVLLILIVLVINMIINLYKSKKIAGILQFPYFIWLLFALYLNIGVAILN